MVTSGGATTDFRKFVRGATMVGHASVARGKSWRVVGILSKAAQAKLGAGLALIDETDIKIMSRYLIKADVGQIRAWDKFNNWRALFRARRRWVNKW